MLAANPLQNKILQQNGTGSIENINNMGQPLASAKVSNLTSATALSVVNGQG